jgi:hypothetical protein
MPRPTASGAWIAADSNTVAAAGLDSTVTGGGFAPGERVDLRVKEDGATVTATLQADSMGRVAGTIRLRRTGATPGLLHLLATGRQSHRTATITVGVLPYVPVIYLAPYAARPGQAVAVAGQGFAPQETVRLRVGSTLLATVRAGADGALQLGAVFTVPFTAPAGRLTITATGETSRHPAGQSLDVLPLHPWVTAATYVVHSGDHVTFDAHEFAAGEVVAVYSGTTRLGQSTGPTDEEGRTVGIGPLAVPAGATHPMYTFVGTRSGARATVTLTVVP